jgi:tRNA 5-methylaminomethyl-2-thiouridine biosynthesis bifunctional protein
LAAGYGVKDMMTDTHIQLRFSRGQLTWAEGDIETATTYGGYALPLKDGLLLGATHQRLDGGNPFSNKPEDDVQNLNNFETFTGVKAQQLDKPSRASVRVTTADTLPMIGLLEDGLWLLTGLGSRGFVFAPLLAEAIVSKICGDPLPIAKSVWKRFGTR